MNQALQKTSKIISKTNDNWATRGDYWLKRINPVPQYKAQKRRRVLSD
tara:strand:- start:1375 stop:1518 length:144 start_codon:yes stop_codon:yes gene_type:complete